MENYHVSWIDMLAKIIFKLSDSFLVKTPRLENKKDIMIDANFMNTLHKSLAYFCSIIKILNIFLYLFTIFWYIWLSNDNNNLTCCRRNCSACCCIQTKKTLDFGCIAWNRLIYGTRLSGSLSNGEIWPNFLFRFMESGKWKGLIFKKMNEKM